MELRKIAVIRSGAQTGADRGGIDAAIAQRTPITGWVPRGGLAEDYPAAPGLLVDYPQMKETPSEGYVQRTAWNVRDSHATLIVAPDGIEPASGTEMTVHYAFEYQRPVLVVAGNDDFGKIVEWLDPLGSEITLNIAGPRASKCERVYGETRALVEALLKAQAPC